MGYKVHNANKLIEQPNVKNQNENGSQWNGDKRILLIMNPLVLSCPSVLLFSLNQKWTLFCPFGAVCIHIVLFCKQALTNKQSNVGDDHWDREQTM